MEWREDAVTGDYLGGWTAVERACESVFFTPDSRDTALGGGGGGDGPGEGAG